MDGRKEHTVQVQFSERDNTAHLIFGEKMKVYAGRRELVIDLRRTAPFLLAKESEESIAKSETEAVRILTE